MRFEFMKMRDPRGLDPVRTQYPGSNHLTVVDGDGNIATVLHSVMSHAWSNALIVDGMNLWAGGVHFFRNMPKPGDRGTCYVAPHIIFDANGRPVLAAGVAQRGADPELRDQRAQHPRFRHGHRRPRSISRGSAGRPSVPTACPKPPSRWKWIAARRPSTRRSGSAGWASIWSIPGTTIAAATKAFTSPGTGWPAPAPTPAARASPWRSDRYAGCEPSPAHRQQRARPPRRHPDVSQGQ